MRRNFVRAVGALAVMGVTGACAALGRQAFTPPVVTVTDVRLVGVGVQGGTLDVLLSLYNPNNYRLDARRFSYRVMVDTVTLGQGTMTDPLTVGGRDSTRVRLPVSFGIREVLAAGSKLLERGSLPYRLVGDITVATPFGDMTRPFDQKGTFNSGDLTIR
jgi:LEA14-like dessication related protein